MIKNDDYRRLIREVTPGSRVAKNCLFAFLFGGGICFVGEGLREGLLTLGLSEENAILSVTVSLILLSVILSAVGVFDRIARIAGAGTLVPVTGFANAVVSPAIDTKAEGPVVGVGSKIFTVAGPVILFAVLSGTVYGLIFWLYRMLTA